MSENWQAFVCFMLGVSLSLNAICLPIVIAAIKDESRRRDRTHRFVGTQSIYDGAPNE